MIERLGELIRAIFGLIREGKFDMAEKEISEAYLTMLRRDSSFFLMIPEDKLTSTLIEDHNYTDAHLETLAELLFAEAELLAAEKKIKESIPYYRKSLLLFEFVDATYRTYSADRIERMEYIRKKLINTVE